MRHQVFVAGALLAYAAIGVSAPSNRSNSGMRDSATHNELSQSLRMAQQSDPIRNIGPAIGKVDEDPSLQNSGRDLIKESTILCYRGNLTLVPNRSVLHIPKNLENRVGEQPNVEIKTWAEFYQLNRGWIRTVEVSRDQALGYAPLPEGTLKAIEESSALVVATFKNGPISVLPLKEPETEAGTDAETESTEESAESTAGDLPVATAN